jgi:hypothetical protein
MIISTTVVVYAKPLVKLYGGLPFGITLPAAIGAALCITLVVAIKSVSAPVAAVILAITALGIPVGQEIKRGLHEHTSTHPPVSEQQGSVAHDGAATDVSNASPSPITIYDGPGNDLIIVNGIRVTGGCGGGSNKAAGVNSDRIVVCKDASAR